MSTFNYEVILRRTTIKHGENGNKKKLPSCNELATMVKLCKNEAPPIVSDLYMIVE